MSEALKSAPTRAWHPQTGESQVFNHPSEVPEGWLDTHPDNIKKDAPKAAEVKNDGEKLSMTRKELVEALAAGGIEHDPKAPVKVLDGVLREAAIAFLTDAKVEFDAKADTKTLVGLLPKPE